MLLTITTTHQPGTDLGFLLHKHPGKLQQVELSHGKAYIFYPEVSKEKCTVALLLNIDAIDMVRGNKFTGKSNFSLGQYINDRPYVASSFMSVAIAKAFSTAMNGTCKKKPELVDTKFPVEVSITSLPASKGGENIIRSLFEPLGYKVELESILLDDKNPDWGKSKYYNITLKNSLKIKDLLSHLYVLIPALDINKHYYISKDEINKLLAKGEGWLKDHPEKNKITKRYLKNLKALSKQAIQRLTEDESQEEEPEEPKAVKEKKQSLHNQRLNTVLEKLKESGAKKVLDLGCGEGRLLRLLLKEKQFTQIVGVDVSYSELLKAKERLHWDRLPTLQKEKIELIQGALSYKDKRIENFEAAAIVEVIEHLEPDRLKAFERVVFEFAAPNCIIITTPNKDYNTLYEFLGSGMRHHDHRFEWTRKEFADWANKISNSYNYSVIIEPIGEIHDEFGASSQMAVFTKN